MFPTRQGLGLPDRETIMTEVLAVPAEPVIDQADAPATETPAAEVPTPDPAAEAAKWKAMARKHEEQAKANADKAKRLDALEEANKSELEKITARAEAAEKAAATAAAELLRSQVAAAKGVPANLIAGETQEALEAAADALLAFKGVAPVVPDATGLGDVGRPIGGVKQLTDAELAAMSPTDINKARAEGRLDGLLGKAT